MTEARAGGSTRAPARHERPALDAAGLEAARHADRLVAAARDLGATRWARYLEPLPDRLRDEEPRGPAPDGDAGAGGVRA